MLHSSEIDQKTSKNSIILTLLKNNPDVDFDQFIDYKKLVESEYCSDLSLDSINKSYKLLLDDDRDDFPKNINVVRTFGLIKAYKLYRKCEPNDAPFDITLVTNRCKNYHRHYIKYLLTSYTYNADDFDRCIEKLYSLGLFNHMMQDYERAYQLPLVLSDISQYKVNNISYLKRILHKYQSSLDAIFAQGNMYHGFTPRVMKYLYKHHEEKLIEMISDFRLTHGPIDSKCAVFMKKHDLSFSYPDKIILPMIVRKCLPENLEYRLMKRVMLTFISRNLTKLSSYFI